MAFVLVCILLPSSASRASAQELQNWANWRGPLQSGQAVKSNPPLTWNEKENIRWKVEIAGVGHSTPVIWQDRVYVTSAEAFGPKFDPKPDSDPGAHDNSGVTQNHRFFVICLERSTGKELWKTKVNELVPHEGGHNTGSLASASPVTDGQRIYAYFGSNGLYCLSKQGKILWEKNLGKMHTKHNHGEGASPALGDDTLVVNWDHQGQSYIVAYNKVSGKEIWKVERTEVTSWSSPIVVKHQGKSQVIVAGTNRVRGYDLKNGNVIWECGGLSNNIVATPIYSDGIVYVGSSYETKALFAIDINDAKGDLTDTKKILWRRRIRTPYVPSPLLFKDQLYFLTHYQGIMTKVTAKTGEEKVGPFRLGGLRNIYASPVAANNAIYVTDLEGATVVFSNDEIPRMISLNRLDENFSASAAIANDEIFLRGKRFLYCIGTPKTQKKTDE